MTDPLSARIRKCLTDLATLSEAPAGNIEAQISRSAPESSIPGELDLDLTANDPPHKERSLHDWYLWHFIRFANDPDRLESLCLIADREFKARTSREEREKTAEQGSILAHSESGSVAEAVAAQRVIEWYQGVHPRDVAVFERQTESWVRKVRMQHGRKPKDGRERPDFLDMDDEDRHRVVVSLAATMGQKRAAAKLGVDRNTVKRYWPEPIAA